MRTPFVAILALIAISTSVSAQAPHSLSFQGYLTRTDGTPLDSSTVSMTFNLYKSGSSVWNETQVVNVDSGYYNVYLGAVTPLDTVAFNQPIDLGVKLDGEDSDILPRTRLAAAAFALGIRGLYAVSATSGNNTGPNLVGGSDRNFVADGVVGATIGGGGGRSFLAWVPDSVLGNWGTVGGGRSNKAGGDNSTVGGGDGNSATGGGATIGGGDNNSVSGYNATVGGGFSYGASGYAATVGGGAGNSASGSAATVGGGGDNSASGNAATVVGGQRNAARGDLSFAAGKFAKANHQGAFVWQDSASVADDSLSSTAAGEFLVRARGGVTFLTAPTRDDSTGAMLAAGSGTWSSLSSESSKTNFSNVDARSYLDRVASLDLKEWSYKTETSVSHVGPMAEDFYAAFGHGPTEKGITTVDADGVALAAIQGLYELVQQQAERITELERRLAEN